MIDPNIEKLREKRRKQTAEVFTPDSLVQEMLDKLPKEVWKENKTFCDPACGNGQFLIWVLRRKIEKGHKPLDALKNIYGADIMKDNIRECRLRLLKVISDHEKIKEEHVHFIFQNIVWINSRTHPEGSLNYDFSFKNNVNSKDVKRWMDYIHKGGVLNDIDLPVKEEKFLRPGEQDMFFEY